MKNLTFLFLAFISVTHSFSQRILSEDVNYYDIQVPNQPLDSSVETYQVQVQIPYTLTVEELEAQSLADFEKEKANYATIVEESKAEYQELLNNHDQEVKKAEERYKLEMEEFKSLSMIERLALTDQGKKPELIVPAKPAYIKPAEPTYQKPNINDYLIFDQQVLQDGVELLGYEKGGTDVLFVINISKMQFKDNAGQTFFSQPTSLKVFKGAELIQEKNFDDEFQFLTASTSNSINLERYEKNNVNKIMNNIQTYINEEFGYRPVSSKMTIEYPKNKDREYDALENAKIKALSAYRKLNEDATLKTRERSKAELAEVDVIWKDELAKADYTDKKARINKDVAKMIFFNRLKVDITLKDKAKAEKTLSEIQNKRIDLDFSNSEERTFTRLEEEVYNM